MLVYLAVALLALLLGGAAAGAQDTARSAGCAPDSARAQQPLQDLTVWLMFTEPAAAEGHQETDRHHIHTEMAHFNGTYGPGCPVTVLNTTIPQLQDQLVVWHPEFAGLMWPMIKGQERTLEALKRFAGERMHLNVLFVPWGHAFDQLRAAVTRGGPHSVVPAPDVAQVGSTWVAHFADAGLLLPQPDSPPDQKLLWRDTSGTRRLALSYILDLRLLFYWRELPGDIRPFSIHDERWETIITSLKDTPEASPPMVMPISLTPNLLHDMVPLVWAGQSPFLAQGSTRVDLTSSQATARLIELAQSATWKPPGANASRRLLAFPEMAHEAATHHFMACAYRAIIEPVGFITRWQAHAAAHTSCGAAQESFWDLVGVAVPPTTFKGGSDLIVLHRTKAAALAFELTRFLATDTQYTSMLAALGHLPAQRADGVDMLLASLGAPSAFSQAFAAVIDHARHEGKEYPALAAFPTQVESREVLEFLQRVWRRIGEGDEDGQASTRVTTAAAEAELAINRRIDRRTWLWGTGKRWWPIIATVLLAVAAGGIVVARREMRHSRGLARAEEQRAIALEERIRAEEERARVLDQIRKVRGFSSAALLIASTVHNILRNPYEDPDAPPNRNKKAAIVAAGLQGWRRGRDPREWHDGPLESVIWRAIMLAIESVRWAGLFKAWEQGAPCTVQVFLQEQGLLRNMRLASHGEPPFCFAVDCSPSAQVPTPFMLEQALVCLLQNAIQASWNDEYGSYFPILVTYDDGLGLLVVSNQGPPLSLKLCKTLNESRDMDDFENRVDKLLYGPDADRPGIGLVEAYCIASQCYEGLSIDSNDKQVSITIKLRAT